MNREVTFQQTLILILALLLFTASAHSISLLSLDDCFYARKGIESERSGRFFTVTWNYQPAFQNPPLQFWILGRSFQLFGENDFAARLPSILMAVGIILLTLRIGSLIASPAAGITAACLLLLSPHFVSNARRCMLEIPLTFWITALFWILLEGLKKPKLLLALCVPLSAAILTKSVLGLLPLFVIAAAAFFIPDIRRILRTAPIWIGILLGLGLGASWSIDQMNRFGMEAIQQHYMGEIASRSGKGLSFGKMIFGYPIMLLSVFQPAALAAIAGTYRVIRSKQHDLIVLIVVWAALPLVLYSISGARSSRYIFPIFPALALCGGWWIESRMSRFSQLLRKWITPILLICATGIYWFAPHLIARDENREMKTHHQIIRNAVPENEVIQYRGKRFWSVANPLLYYADRQLSDQGTYDAVPGPIIIDRELKDLPHLAKFEKVFETETWILLIPK